MDQSQGLINPFVPETTESACICKCILHFCTYCITFVVDIIMAVVLLYTRMLHKHNNTTITSDTVLRKIYLSLYLKGLCVRGSWRPNRTATYWPPLLWPSAFLSRLRGCSTGGLGPSLSGCWFSLLHLISNSSDPQLLNRGSGAHSAGCWLSLLHLVWFPNLLTSCLHRVI